MDKENDILTRAARRDGMTVPDGFFDSFPELMMSKLGEHPAFTAERVAPKPSTWMRIRPFVYLAAMFAGIWLMLNMFSFIGNNHDDLSVDNNPIIARALSSDSFVDDYYLYDIDENEMLDDIYDMGITPEELSDSTFEFNDPSESADDTYEYSEGQI